MSGLREGRTVVLRATSGDRGAVQARVVRASDARAVLDVPLLAAGRTGLEAGARVEIAWKEWRSQGVVPGIVETAGATLVVRLEAERRQGQRRAYVRTPSLLALEVTTPSGQVVRGVGLDVSAVGIRARVPIHLETGQGLHLGIRLPDGDAMDVAARVVRRHAGSIVGLAFVGVDERSRDRLVRFVLASQQRALARRAGPPPATRDVPAPPALRRVGGEGAPPPA